MQQARSNGQEIGAADPSAAVGNFLKFAVNLVGAKSVVEIGTGSGVGGLWLLSGMAADSVLTTIDSEREHSKIARTVFEDADIAPTKYRIITGKLIEVIGKLADNAYDLVIIRPALDLFEMVQESYRLLKPGGLLIIDQALSGGKVADPTQRDPESIARRDAIKVVKEDERWAASLLPIGEGLLLANKLTQMRQPSDTPWWQASAETKPVRMVSSRSTSNFFVVAVVIALIAGGFGAAIGRGSATNLGANLVQTTNSIERAPDSIAGLAARVIPAVVSIAVKGFSGSGTGSGFFLDSDGFILTNNHVVEAAARSGTITVELSDGKKYRAKLIGRDSSYDLAVLKIDVVGAPTLQLGNSEQVQVGDAVIAIGSPLGLSGTVTSGIISSKNRAVTTGNGNGESSFINALQTDAAINPGNSGGPLVDATGAVIGVNSAIATLGFSSQAGSIGLGFAIPINQAKKTAEQLIKTGSATYPIMGISVDTRFTGTGALITSEGVGITPGGPADKVGLKAGDVIIEFDGSEVDNSDELIVMIRSKSVGDKVKIKYKRNSLTKEVTVTLIASKE